MVCLCSWFHKSVTLQEQDFCQDVNTSHKDLHYSRFRLLEYDKLSLYEYIFDKSLKNQMRNINMNCNIDLTYNMSETIRICVNKSYVSNVKYTF